MVGAPKDTASFSKVGGSVNLCEVVLRPTASSSDCQQRDTKIGSSNGDIFEDQMLGINVVATDGGGQGSAEVLFYSLTFSSSWIS